MTGGDLRAQNEASRAAWDANAPFWDERMGDAGNRLVESVLWPATQRLLGVRAGERVLDAATGNGLYARRLSAAGATVVAFDFVASLIERAGDRGAPTPGSITYHVADATDEAAIAALGDVGSFDAALCAMALMDMPAVEPLMRAAHRLLRPSGRFVWSIMHPAFNQSRATRLAEERYQPSDDAPSQLVTGHSMRISGYLTPTASSGSAIIGQAREQPYFERPVGWYAKAAVDAGFVLDALEEPAFPSSAVQPEGWDVMRTEFPMVLIARLRRL